MTIDRIGSPRDFLYDDLNSFTNGFSVDNFIGETQFGKVYRGKIHCGTDVLEVTVKIWTDYPDYPVKPEDKIWRLKEEVKLLQQQSMSSHPNLPKLIGYCSEGEQVGIVYDLNARDTLFNFVCDESFTWTRRINVALELACLISFLHNEKTNSQGYLIRNISPAHILIDQDFRPIIFDFGMLSGGILPDRTDIEGEELLGYHGYYDELHACPGLWSDKCDVYSFACVLIGLISNKVYCKKGHELIKACGVYGWASYKVFTPGRVKKMFIREKRSIVAESLKLDEGFNDNDGILLSKLVVQCLDEHRYLRPTMENLVQSLSLVNGHVVHDYVNAFYITREHTPRRLHILSMIPFCK